MMQLTNEEREALELWSTCDPTALGGVCNDVDAAVVLSDAMLRLFPVRTYGEMVIRWDDEITPERLVACGWTETFEGSFHAYGKACKASYYPKFRRSFDIFYREWNVTETICPPMTPRNMGEVWNLMERIEGGRESGAEPTHGLPAGVCVSPSFLNGLWHWTVRDAVTNAVIEFGTEPTELAAVRMAWEAYDRSTADDTSIVERRAN